MRKTGELNACLWEMRSGQEKPAKNPSGEKMEETWEETMFKTNSDPSYRAKTNKR